MKLIQLVDSLTYVEGNCYQHQLLRDLRRRHGHQVVELAGLGALRNASSDAIILSTAKIRTVYANLDRYAAILGDRKLYVYDQDPWESFIDTASYPGGYFNVKRALPGAEFIVVSGWWAEHIRRQGLPAHFCRCWVLPEYCTLGQPSSARVPGLAFKGQLHGFRKVGVDAMATLETNVDVSRSASYPDWLKWLQTRQAFFHDESDTWEINRVATPKQCSVNKDIEIASQGCFVFRDSKSIEEVRNYGADKLPSVITFDSYDHCAERLKWLQSLSDQQRDEMVTATVNAVREADGWSDMSRILGTGA